MRRLSDAVELTDSTTLPRTLLDDADYKFDDGLDDDDIVDDSVARAVDNFVPLDDDDGFSPVFERDGPQSRRPPSLTPELREEMSGARPPRWMDGIVNQPNPRDRYSTHEQNSSLDRFRHTCFGRNFYHMRYPLVILTVIMQAVFQILGMLSGVIFVNSTFVMLNDTGDETIVFRGYVGDNISKHSVDGVLYQSLGGASANVVVVGGAVCAAQILIDLAVLLHVATFVRRISLRVAFTFLVGEVLSFAFYFQFMDLVSRFNSNSSCFIDERGINPCSRSEGIVAAYARYLYFSIATVTSTGFGDVSPVYLFTKIVAATEMFIGIAFGVFIVTASLSRFSASVVSKSNARKLLKKQMRALKRGRKTQVARLNDMVDKLKRKEIFVKLRRAVRRYFLAFTLVIQILVLFLLYFGNLSPDSCGVCNASSCDSDVQCKEPQIAVITPSKLEFVLCVHRIIFCFQR